MGVTLFEHTAVLNFRLFYSIEKSTVNDLQVTALFQKVKSELVSIVERREDACQAQLNVSIQGREGQFFIRA